jgi:hypothetical protein
VVRHQQHLGAQRRRGQGLLLRLLDVAHQQRRCSATADTRSTQLRALGLAPRA